MSGGSGIIQSSSGTFGVAYSIFFGNTSSRAGAFGASYVMKKAFIGIPGSVSSPLQIYYDVYHIIFMVKRGGAHFASVKFLGQDNQSAYALANLGWLRPAKTFEEDVGDDKIRQV